MRFQVFFVVTSGPCTFCNQASVHVVLTEEKSQLTEMCLKSKSSRLQTINHRSIPYI